MIFSSLINCIGWQFNNTYQEQKRFKIGRGENQESPRGKQKERVERKKQ